MYRNFKTVIEQSPKVSSVVIGQLVNIFIQLQVLGRVGNVRGFSFCVRACAEVGYSDNLSRGSDFTTPTREARQYNP